MKQRKCITIRQCCKVYQWSHTLGDTAVVSSFIGCTYCSEEGRNIFTHTDSREGIAVM